MNGKGEEVLCRIKLQCLYTFSIIPSKMGAPFWHFKIIYFLSATSKDKKGGKKNHYREKKRIITFPVLPILPLFPLWVFLLLLPTFFTWSQTLCLWHHSGCCGGDYDVQSQKRWVKFGTKTEHVHRKQVNWLLKWLTAIRFHGHNCFQICYSSGCRDWVLNYTSGSKHTTQTDSANTDGSRAPSHALQSCLLRLPPSSGAKTTQTAKRGNRRALRSAALTIKVLHVTLHAEHLPTPGSRLMTREHRLLKKLLVHYNSFCYTDWFHDRLLTHRHI